MQSWKDSGKSLEWLVDEYVNKGKSLSRICWDNNINLGSGGMGKMSAILHAAGYNLRNKYKESAEKRKITKDNLYERWGIEWDELVEWYNARKSLAALCGKHGFSSQRSVVLKRLLADNGVLTDDPLRGFGFTEDELIRMHREEGLSIYKIRKKFNLSRHAGTIMSSILFDKRYKDGSNGDAKYTSDDGYTRVTINDKNKHLTNVKAGGQDMEHRLVVAASIGRTLKHNEWVHHINRDKSDNRLSNLLLVDKSTHRRIHVSMDKVIEDLFKTGLVVLNKGDEYEVQESDDYNRGFTDGIQSMLELE